MIIIPGLEIICNLQPSMNTKPVICSQTKHTCAVLTCCFKYDMGAHISYYFSKSTEVSNYYEYAFPIIM